MKLRLIVYNDIKYNVNELLAARRRVQGAGWPRANETALDAILWSASGLSSEEDLSWVLVDETA